MVKENLQQRIADILNKHDPIGLIKLGCPADEYHSEAKLILERVPKCKSNDEAADTIYSIFVKMFEFDKPKERTPRHIDKGGAGKKEDYRRIAEEIYPLLR